MKLWLKSTASWNSALSSNAWRARVNSRPPDSLSLHPNPKDIGSLFDEPETSAATDMSTAAHDYVCITDTESLHAAVDRAIAAKAPVGVTVYAAGESAMTAQWQGIAFSVSEGSAVYAEAPGDDAPEDQLRSFTEEIKRLFDGVATVVSHDVKRAIIVLRRHGIAIGNYYDTSLAH